MRILGAATAILTFAALAAPAWSFADQQTPSTPAWVNFPDPGGDIFALVNSRVQSETGTAADCDHSASSPNEKGDDHKPDQTSAGDSSSDADTDSDQAAHDDDSSKAPAASPASDEKDGDNASAQDDDHVCEPPDAQDADAPDSGGEQDADDQSVPDDDQRNYQESKVDLYHDSDGYKTTTIANHNHLVLDNFILDFANDTVIASDAAGSVRSEDTMFSFLDNLNENFGIGGGFGTVNSQGWSLPIGLLKTTASLAGLSIETGLSHTLLATVAQTIRNRITQTDASASVSYEITRNFVPSLEFHHINYSDHNSSLSMEFSPKYTFHLRASQLQFGYDFTYQSFATNTENGYWAPQRALTNEVSGSWSFNREAYYGRVETGFGYGSVRESGALTNGPSSGPDASAGFVFGLKPFSGVTLETYWTGEGSPGWSSMNVGLSLKYFF